MESPFESIVRVNIFERTDKTEFFIDIFFLVIIFVIARWLGTCGASGSLLLAEASTLLSVSGKAKLEKRCIYLFCEHLYVLRVFIPYIIV